VLTALLIGFNEIAMFLWDLALVALIVVALLKRWRWMYLAPTLAAAVLASAVVIKSPSNALRASHYPTSKQPVKAASRALLHTAIKIGLWSLDPALWLGSLLLIPTWRRWPNPSRLDWLHRRWALPLVATTTVAILSLGAFPAYYGMGHPPPQRACNMLYLVFAVGWFGALCSLATSRPQWAPVQFRTWPLALMLFLFGNWPFAVWTGSTTAPAYRREYDARSQAVAQALARGDRQIEFEPLRHRPRLLFYADLQTESDYWINLMYARRVHLDAVTLRDPSRQSSLH